MPVMAVPEALADAVDAEVRVAILPAETMEKQLLRFPELTVEDYRRLPSMGAAPTLVIRDGASTFVLERMSDGRWRCAVLKIAEGRSAAFMTSYRITSEESVAQLLERDGVTVLLDRRDRQ